MRLLPTIFKAPFFKGLVLLIKLLIILPFLKKINPVAFTNITLWLSSFAILRALIFPSWQVAVNFLLNSQNSSCSYPRVYYVLLCVLFIMTYQYPIAGLMLIVEWLYLHTVKTKFKLLEKDGRSNIFLQYNWEIIESLIELVSFIFVLLIGRSLIFIFIWFSFRFITSIYFRGLLKFKNGASIQPIALLDSTVEGFSLKMIIEIPIFLLITTSDGIAIKSSYSMLRYVLNALTTGVNMVTGPLITFFHAVSIVSLKHFALLVIWLGSLVTALLCFTNSFYYLSSIYAIAFIFGATAKRLSYSNSFVSAAIFGVPVTVSFYVGIEELQGLIALLVILNYFLSKRILSNEH
jgi:hypothetical protein